MGAAQPTAFGDGEQAPQHRHRQRGENDPAHGMDAERGIAVPGDELRQRRHRQNQQQPEQVRRLPPAEHPRALVIVGRKLRPPRRMRHQRRRKTQIGQQQPGKGHRRRDARFGHEHHVDAGDQQQRAPRHPWPEPPEAAVGAIDKMPDDRIERHVDNADDEEQEADHRQVEPQRAGIIGRQIDDDGQADGGNRQARRRKGRQDATLYSHSLLPRCSPMFGRIINAMQARHACRFHQCAAVVMMRRTGLGQGADVD